MFKNIALYLIEHNLIAIVFYKILYMSIIGSLIGIVILCIRKIFGKRY